MWLTAKLFHILKRRNRSSLSAIERLKAPLPTLPPHVWERECKLLEETWAENLLFIQSLKNTEFKTTLFYYGELIVESKKGYNVDLSTKLLMTYSTLLVLQRKSDGPPGGRDE